MKPITIISGNPGKIKEIEAIAIGKLNFKIRSLDLIEIQSINTREIVDDKIKRAYEIVKSPVIVEDVSAGLDHLNGLPGPFFKFFEKALGKEALLEISTIPNPKVTIKCVAAYYDGKHMLIGEGIIHGRVVRPRGERGFGFDFIVVPEGEERTMAEMTAEEKNSFSHRGQAFRSLFKQIEQL